MEICNDRVNDVFLFIVKCDLPKIGRRRRVFKGKTPPNFTTTHFSSKNGLPYTRPRLLSYCARKSVHEYGL